MKIQRAYKTQLNPNNAQITLFKKACGTARFAYNWGLSQRIQQYENTGKSDNYYSQKKQFNQAKKIDFAWAYEVSKCVGQEALRNLDIAYAKFFKKTAGFPKFKSRHNSNQSFSLYGAIHVANDTIQLPRIGKVRLWEKGYLPCNTKIISTTVSLKAEKWFVSIQVEEEIEDGNKNTSDVVIGIDFGIKELAVCSNGMRFENPKHLKQKEHRLKRYQRKLARQIKGSKNRQKTKNKIATVHYKIACARKDSAHKMTTSLVKTKPKAIVIETLRVSNMVKNHKLAKSISDCGWNEKARQLRYKCLWNGIELKEVDTFFPSSKLCSVCGYKNTGLLLSDRQWVCPECQSKHDRDFNASKNLELCYMGGLPKFQACGQTYHYH